MKRDNEEEEARIIVTFDASEEMVADIKAMVKASGVHKTRASLLRAIVSEEIRKWKRGRSEPRVPAPPPSEP